MTEQHYAVTVIQENKSIPIRRESDRRTIHMIKQGNQTRYFRFYDKHKTVEQIEENEALINLGDTVTFMYGGDLYTGKVAVIVPPKQGLMDRLETLRKFKYLTGKIEEDLRRRQQRSYLVAVGKTLYWPMVSTIRKLHV